MERRQRRRTEPGPHVLGVGAIARSPQRAGDEVGGDACTDADRDGPGNVGRSQRKRHPLAGEVQPPVATPLLEVVAEELVEQGSHPRLRGGMESMATEVDSLAPDGDAGCHPAESR